MKKLGFGLMHLPLINWEFDCIDKKAAGSSIPVDTVAQPIVVSLTPRMDRATGVAAL